jgi:hypothetical protein
MWLCGTTTSIRCGDRVWDSNSTCHLSDPPFRPIRQPDLPIGAIGNDVRES